MVYNFRNYYLTYSSRIWSIFIKKLLIINIFFGFGKNKKVIKNEKVNFDIYDLCTKLTSVPFATL